MTRAILFTDQCLLVQGVEAVFQQTERMRLVGVCNDLADLFEKTQDPGADLVLFDLEADVTWACVTDYIAKSPQVRVLLLTRKASPELMIHGREIGAAGLLDTTISPDTLLQLLDQVDQEAVFTCPLETSLPPATSVRLSPREGQLVEMLAQGHTNKEIATALGIGQGTVKVYLSNLFRKVGAKDRLELALFGLRNAGSHTADRRLSDMRSLVLTAGPAARAQSAGSEHL